MILQHLIYYYFIMHPAKIIITACFPIVKNCSFLLTGKHNSPIIILNRETVQKGKMTMRPIDSGCREDSNVYFYTASEQTKQTFFYPLCAGHYYCSSKYMVQRNNYDSFLLIFVKKGGGYLQLGDKRHPFHAEDIVLVDCYEPHEYATTRESELIWVHFDGATSREYVSSILASSGPVCSVKNLLSFEKDLNRLILMISSSTAVNDALCSYYLVKILTDILVSFPKHRTAETAPGIMEDIISYITNNICSPLSLEDLSGRAGLSPFYFTRVFKKETGHTPHEYIILSRINIAKFYLKSTSYTIKEICFNSGFSSESSFCSTFRRVCGLTPSEYREDRNFK